MIRAATLDNPIVVLSIYLEVGLHKAEFYAAIPFKERTMDLAPKLLE